MKKYYIVIVLLLLISTAFAQQKISGFVVDGKGRPLAGAEIKESSTTNTTLSDKDGAFTLEVKSKESQLTISLNGYKEVSISVSEVSSKIELSKSKGKPVRKPFNSSFLIDNQTHVTPTKGSFEFVIHHRFGLIEDYYDLFGLYAPSNIRLGFNYGITDELMVGIGSEKNNMMQEIFVKYAILRQTRTGSIPVSLSIVSTLNIDARQDPIFGENYKFTNRFGYFNQLILGRKFNKRLSIQGTASFSHFNAVDSVWQHDKAGVSIGGKYTFYDNISFIGEYDFPISVKTVRYYQQRVKPNMAFGVEFGTSTHAFQVFAANYSHINSGKNYVFNTNDFTEGEFLMGFNITARF